MYNTSGLGGVDFVTAVTEGSEKRLVDSTSFHVIEITNFYNQRND